MTIALPCSDALASACFDAGGALALLGSRLAAPPPHLGVWLARLALKAAAAGLALSGRREDEAMVRDAVLLTRPGDDAGPAGRAFALWVRVAGQDPRHLDAAALPAALAEALAAAPPGRPAPLAAADAALELARRLPREPGLALLAGDVVLARALRWPCTVPLLATGFGRRLPLHDDWPVACASATATAAEAARRLFDDLAWRAETLQTARRKLRSKEAAAVVAALLRHDAVSGSVLCDRIAPAMSDRAARRALERLVALGGARELTGRPTHRLYGL